MGVHEGRGQLARAFKDLMARWADTKISWNDAVSQRFEKECLFPLEADLKSCGAAMDHMAAILEQIRRDCGE